MPAPAPFSQTTRTITADRRLTDFDVRVFNAAASFRSSESGLAWPSRTTIAEIVGGHVGSVSRSIGRLADCGHITISPRPGQTNMVSIPSPYSINQEVDPGPSAATTTLNPTVTGTLNPTVNQSNKSEKTKIPPPAPATEDHQVEGEFVFRSPNPEPVCVRPWEITPEPIPTYQVTEEVVEHFTLDTLPAEIKALDRPEQLNPVVLLPILVSLLGVAPDLAQALLDELSGRLACQSLKAIDSPISYFRYLVREAKAGRFTARYGLDIAASRRATAAHQARLAGSAPPPPTITPDRQPESKMSADELRAMMRQALRGGAA